MKNVLNLVHINGRENVLPIKLNYEKLLETYAKHFLTKGGNMKLGKTLDIYTKN